MKNSVFFSILIVLLLFLSSCQSDESSSCLTCRGSWLNDINRAIAGINTSNGTTIINNYYGGSNVTVYNITSVQTIYGTSTTSNLNLLKIYDSQTWNISESNGLNPLEFRVNITGVSSFNKILLRERYLGGAGHEIGIELWDYVSSTWESYYIITDQGYLVIDEIPVLDQSRHLSGGKVQLRFIHSGTGISSHRLFIDFIFLMNSNGAYLGNPEHDSLSGRNNGCINHPELCEIANANYTAIKLNLSTNFLTKTQDYINDSASWQKRTDWTTHDSYPNECSGLTNVVTGLGDTLSCIDLNKNIDHWFNYSTSAYTTSVNTTYTNMLNFKTPLQASSTYLIRCDFLTYSAAASTGERLRVNTTGSPTKVTLSFCSQVSATTTTCFQGTSTSSNVFADTGSAGTNVRDNTRLRGIIQTSATASTVTFETRSEISASSETYDIGSYCEYVKVS